jgi:hypothetical protein
LATFEIWLLLVDFDNAEWIRRQWVGMFMKRGASEIPEAKIKEKRVNKRTAADLRERAGKNTRRNIPTLPNTRFTIIIH